MRDQNFSLARRGKAALPMDSVKPADTEFTLFQQGNFRRISGGFPWRLACGKVF